MKMSRTLKEGGLAEYVYPLPQTFQAAYMGISIGDYSGANEKAFLAMAGNNVQSVSDSQ